MWWFKKKEIPIVHPIPSNAVWGQLVGVHKIDVDTLSGTMRCVKKEDSIKGCKVTRLRIFDFRLVENKGITVTGWDTFDQNPEVLAFEGYVTEHNHVHLEKINF